MPKQCKSWTLVGHADDKQPLVIAFGYNGISYASSIWETYILVPNFYDTPLNQFQFAPKRLITTMTLIVTYIIVFQLQ